MQKSSEPASAIMVALADHPAHALIRSHLEHSRFRVVEADDLDSCLAAIRQSDARLIVLGHQARGMDSTALCAQIRLAPEAQHCSLLLIHETTPSSVALDQLHYVTTSQFRDPINTVSPIHEIKTAANPCVLSDPQMEPFLQLLAQGVLIFDRAGNLILANASAERILWGQEAAANTGVHAPDLDWLTELIVEQHAQINLERRHQRPDGSLIDIQVMTVPVDTLSNPLHGCAAIITDISERKRAERLEREQQQMWEAFSAVTDTLAHTRDLAVIWPVVLEQVGKVVDHDYANIMLIDGDVARVTYTQGYPPDTDALLRGFAFSLDMPSLACMLRTGETYSIEDVFNDSEWVVFLEEQAPTYSYLAAPIRIHDRVVGFFNLDSKHKSAFSSDDAVHLQTYVNHVAIAIENLQIYDVVQPDAEQLRALYNATAFLFTAHFVSSETIEHLGRQIVDAIVREFQHVTCTLMLVDQAQTHLVLLAHAGSGCSDPQPYLVLSGDGPLEQVVRGKSSVFVPKPIAEPHEDTPACAQLILPLRAGKSVLGVLQLCSEHESAFGLQQQQILRIFAERAAAALENLHLYQQIRRYADELEVRVDERTAELNRVKERVEAILNHSSDAIFLIRPNGTIQQVNDSFKRQFGYQSDEVYGLPLDRFVDAPSVTLLRGSLDRVIETQQAERIELTALTASGRFDADMTMSPLTAPPDKVVGVVCSIRDISDRKQLEANLRAALENERELNEMQAQFITRASHEFRTPLAVISTAGELLTLYGSRLSDVQKNEKIEQIQGEVKVLTKLLDDMLTVSRGYALRDVVFEPKPFDLAALCREVVSEFEQTNGSAHQLIYSSAGVENQLTADRKLIRRVLVNLLSNAVKYSPAGSKIMLLTTSEPAITTITVKDEGVGISREDQKRLFQPFHRGGQVEAIEGAGLGLAIVKEFVEAHKGTVSFESEPGIGTTFVVTLPTVSLRDKEA